MREIWKETTIGEQVTLQRGFDITRIEQKLGKIPVISSGGISSFHDKAQVAGPGVILGRKGVVGSVYYIESDYWPHDTTLWVKDFHGNDPRFVYYFFKNFAPRLIKLDVGSANPTLNRNHVHPTETIWPSHPTQHAIARILGSLDDKIELNRQMNETLEAMAQAIFQSWFINFDPVRAKAEGRQPAGMDAETAALFPSEFEEVDGREVPRGWGIEPLDKIAIFLNGLALQNYPAESNDVFLPVIKIAQMHKGNTEGSDKASNDIPPEYIINDGDVLFSWSGSLEVILWCGGKGALNQHLFKVSSELYSKWFYYYWTLNHLFDFQLIAEGKATTMGHIQRHHLSEAMVIVPPSDLMEQMDKVMAPLVNKIVANAIESRTLSQVRDALLPKLMRGEISTTGGMAYENP